MLCLIAVEKITHQQVCLQDAVVKAQACRGTYLCNIEVIKTSQSSGVDNQKSLTKNNFKSLIVHRNLYKEEALLSFSTEPFLAFFNFPVKSNDL